MAASLLAKELAQKFPQPAGTPPQAHSTFLHQGSPGAQALRCELPLPLWFLHPSEQLHLLRLLQPQLLLGRLGDGDLDLAQGQGSRLQSRNGDGGMISPGPVLLLMCEVWDERKRRQGGAHDFWTERVEGWSFLLLPLAERGYWGKGGFGGSGKVSRVEF